MQVPAIRTASRPLIPILVGLLAVAFDGGSRAAMAQDEVCPFREGGGHLPWPDEIEAVEGQMRPY